MAAPGNIVIILGPPASGKGTQCELLVQRYGLLHVSTGDLLRSRARFLPELAEFMSKGVLVPDELINQVLEERLSRPDTGSRGVLLDGYPRTRKQAERLAAMGWTVKHVILLDVPEEVLISRVEGRRIDPVSGRVFHISQLPNDLPEAVKGRLIQRKDDTRAKILVRLQEYRSNIEELVDVYQAELRKIRFVDIARPGQEDIHPEQMFDAVRQALEGDQYWGTRFNTEFRIKEDECGSSFVDLLSLSRYFEHLRWRMLNFGCLKDTIPAGKVRCLVRAQECQLNWPLSTDLAVVGKCSLRYVGITCVELGFVLIDASTGRELASGSCELVYVEAQPPRQRIPVPGRERLLQLVESSKNSMRHGHRRKRQQISTAPQMSVDGGDRPSSTEDDIASKQDAVFAPPQFSTEVLVSPADVDGSGSLQTSCVLRRALDTVYAATMSGATAPLPPLTALPLRRVSLEFLQAVQPGTRVVIEVWSPSRATENPAGTRLVRVCFRMIVQPAPSEGSGASGDAPEVQIVGQGDADIELAVEFSRL